MWNFLWSIFALLPNINKEFLIGLNNLFIHVNLNCSQISSEKNNKKQLSFLPVEDMIIGNFIKPMYAALFIINGLT